jgi:dTDP-4-amino-4,6-dideoxygalactose transaminase
MRTNFLPFSPPFIGSEEIDAVSTVLRSGWITSGPGVKSFEAQFASFVGTKDALALNSCTAGLHIALVMLGIGPGDEVIVPTMTFAATANVVEHVGARPVLVDVEADTLNIDPNATAEAITPRTRAIIPVHYGGHPADMDALLALADKHGLAIIEDAAHAVSASYKGKSIGSIGDLTAFSFYATKNLTTGEGGMLTVGRGRTDLAEARVLALHGMSRDAWKRYSREGSWYYEIVAPGYKYNMTDIQAAIGQVQLNKLPAMQARRRAIVEQYQRALEPMAAFILPVERDEVESAWHLFPIRLNSEWPINRNDMIELMKQQNIGTSVHFIPLHVHPFYREKYSLRPEQFPVAQKAYERLVSIPLHPGLSEADISDILSAIHRIISGDIEILK